LAPKATVFGEVTQNNGHYMVQDHSLTSHTGFNFNKRQSFIWA